ncbi:MAG: prepilin-type N-terminal cleavage/methylation domain-containing protein [Lacunisphaera sp.]
MKRTTPTLRGFTLVEVLISLAIFALAAVVLAVTYLNILGGYQAVGHRQQSEEEWKLIRSVVLSESDRTKVEAGGQLQLPDNSNVQWKATIESTTVADLFTVTIQSQPEFATGNDSRVQEQKIMLLRPSWSDPVERNQLRAASQAKLFKDRQQ